MAAKCLFVSSYHQGYAWSDGVEQGLREVLVGHCDLRQFDMDSKRRKSEQEKQQAAEAARNLIETWQPDVVIAADDNAAKYLIEPFFKDHETPFVFCGVNWSAEEYGFPFSNVTGIVEVAPIEPLLNRAYEIVSPAKRAIYLGADTLTERKNLERFQRATARLGIDLESRLVEDTEGWLKAYRDGQTTDFLILGSNSGINDWDPALIADALPTASHRLTVTTHGWMMPYSMFGLTKVPQEHGAWAAETALEILRGTPPDEIPIITNRKWDVWANRELLSAAGIELPRHLSHKAKRVQ
jgi:ABC-type uncharacterized transport system substrate-binding protein